MATIRIPIMGIGTNPDDTGNTFLDRVDNQLGGMTNVKDQLCMVMQAPAGGGDTGFHGSFKIPKNYVGTPKIIITGVLSVAVTNVLAFGMTLLGRADSESIDTAYEAEATVSNSTWTGYAIEDMIELSFTPTGTLAVDDTIVYYFYREDGADDSTIDFLLTSLEFEYADA